MNLFASLLLACTLGAPAATACAQQAQRDQTTVDIKSMAALPADIRDGLVSYYGEVSDFGGPFNSGCVILRGVPRHRIVRASIAGDVALVEIEHGGRAHYAGTLIFQNANGRWQLVRDGNQPVPTSAILPASATSAR